MHPALLIGLIGLLYLLGFGGLSLLRQQGLSVRFALEGLIVTALGAALALAAIPLSPLLFLIILYLVTMRVRLLVDLGNWFTSRGKCDRALALYRFAGHLWPDAASKQIVLINRGVAELRMHTPEEAYHTLSEALTNEKVRTGARYLAAGYYNLGLACRRTGREAEATRHMNEAIDVCPNSVYARAARRTLKERTERQEQNNVNDPQPRSTL